MAYVTPTVEMFKARFPEFAPVDDVLVGLVLQEAIDQVGDTWVGRDRARAQMLLAAHNLTMEGEPGRTATGQGSAGLGQIKRDKVGDTETEFATPTASANAGYLGSLALTYYGKTYLALVAVNFPAVAVV